ncbi:hypothetical protein [Ligilactobacillus salivarius]|uniref:hypothetical protein n=1 Tax=Ligilactobacillus salivarius TaxID=1624 RepID=UPI003D2D2129
MGKKCVYREVGLKQPELFCRNHYQQTYKCNHCHPKGGDKIIVSKVPTSPIFPHSYFSSSVLAKIIVDKYGMAVPLNRQKCSSSISAYQWIQIKCLALLLN